MDLIQYVEEQMLTQTEMPKFRPGDTIVLEYEIVEGEKKRIQAFKGDVIQIKGKGKNKTFTVRKFSNGIGVERILPFSSPNIKSVKVLKRGKVRRARLFYLRKLVGKKAKIKERQFIKKA